MNNKVVDIPIYGGYDRVCSSASTDTKTDSCNIIYLEMLRKKRMTY